MGNVTSIRDGEYRLLVLEADKARGAYAIADMEAQKELTESNATASTNALKDLIQAQRALEKHVKEYGIPKLGQRV